MRDPSPYAGRKVRLKSAAAELGGHDFQCVDWFANTGQLVGWREALEAGDPRAMGYAVRRGLGGLPEDDEVLFGRVDGMGQLVHVTEIEGHAGTQPDPRGPKPADERAVGLPCPACQIKLTAKDIVALLVLGPGRDSEARVQARAGLPFQGVAVELHWACVTGDEQYERREPVSED
jgi:hypothetical protein